MLVLLGAGCVFVSVMPALLAQSEMVALSSYNILRVATWQQVANNLNPFNLFKRSNVVSDPLLHKLGRQSCVQLQIIDANNQTRVGSGFFIETPQGHCVITAHHCIESATAVSVVYPGYLLGKTVQLDVRVVLPENDLALLTFKPGHQKILENILPEKKIIPLQIGCSKVVKPGEKVFVVGYAQNALQPAVFSMVKKERAEWGKSKRTGKSLLISPDLLPGYSGSPCLNENLQVIGVVSACLSNNTTVLSRFDLYFEKLLQAFQWNQNV
jgi:S1-C subfamily serine protease